MSYKALSLPLTKALVNFRQTGMMDEITCAQALRRMGKMNREDLISLLRFLEENSRPMVYRSIRSMINKQVVL